MLDEAKQNQFIDLIENYVYTLVSDHIKELNESEDYESFDMDELKQYAKNSISEWFFEDEDMLSEDVINDQVVIDDIVDTIFEDIEEACKKESCDCGKPDCPICSKKESCKEGDDDDEDPDKDDDKDDGDDDVDEAALLTKHKITKIQSVLDARKRATDPAWKMSRRRTLMKQAARGGRVVNKNGEPVAGAAVMVKGDTSIGTMTDIDGNFSIECPAPSVLIFSSLSYKDQEMTVTIPVNNLSIELEDDTEQLEEIVVVGYGKQKRETVTGSIATVKGTELRRSPEANLTNSLVGRMPGEKEHSAIHSRCL